MNPNHRILFYSMFLSMIVMDINIINAIDEICYGAENVNILDVVRIFTNLV